MTLKKQLIERSALIKKNGQDLGAFLKAGKADKFLDVVQTMTAPESGLRSWSFPYDRTLYTQLTVDKLDGFTDQRLEGIINAFEYLSPNETRMEENANQLAKEFTFVWNFQFNEETVRIQIDVKAVVKSDSPTCRKEVIGYTDPKPAPIYKIVCDDGADTPRSVIPPEPPVEGIDPPHIDQAGGTGPW